MSTPAWQFSDVNEAYSELMTAQRHFTEWEDTRNGRARVFKTPVMVAHLVPWRRVLFDPKRDANPFFHYMEAIWMLAGSDNLAFPARFAANIANYSDDGKHLHGAYGRRWAEHFNVNQVEEVIKLLKGDRTTRRAVIAMWDPPVDLGVNSKDLPCNTHLYFRAVGKELTMTVCNRSNDLVWGMLGANIVHFSILQEYIAHAVGLHIGTMYQFTNNLHIYEKHVVNIPPVVDRWYSTSSYTSVPFTPNTFYVGEARNFIVGEKGATCDILTRNAEPMLDAWNAYKDDKFDLALEYVEKIYDGDWRRACTMWLERRKK